MDDVDAMRADFGTANILRGLGFDVKPWQMPLEGGLTDMLQISDSTGLTFYVRADCSVAQALERYAQKLKDFAVNK